MQGLTAQLADFAANAGAMVLPEAVRATVRNGFTDTVAVVLAGRDEPVTRIARGFVAARGGTAQAASLLLGIARGAVRDAAWLNATAGHAMDYDDVGLQGHPSVVLVPALLAEGERLGASGEALLRAYVVGYEVWAELIARDADLHHLKGWHPTGVFGPVAVAAAVAALRGFDAQRCSHAIGLAASMAGGLIANFGSMAKPLHAGLAAAHGIDAADLAQAGMTAAPDVFERPAGYLAALSPAGRVRLAPLEVPLGKALQIARIGLTVKKYPMCFATHRVIDATLDLARTHEIRAADVAAVHATIGVAQDTMLRNHRPTNGLEGKFSLEFAIAAALVAGRVGLAELHDEFVRAPQVRALFERVHIGTTTTSHPFETVMAASDRVVIETTDGRRVDSGEVTGARGDAQTPLAAHELRAKFDDCCAHAGVRDAGALFALLARIDDLADVRELVRAFPAG